MFIEKINFRIYWSLIFLFCLSLLVAADVIEYVFGIAPCPLCLFQRYLFFVIAAVVLIGTLFNPKKIGIYIYSFIVLLFSLLGAGIAAWQVWLQHLPPSEAPACTSSLERLMQVYPLLEVIKRVLAAPGECAKVDFTILGLSLAAWSLVAFLILAIAAVFSIKLYTHKNRRCESGYKIKKGG